MGTNAQFHKALKGRRAEFFLCDLHVHSPASFDVRTGERFSALSEAERTPLEGIPESAASDKVEYERAVLRAFPVAGYLDLLCTQRDRVAKQEGLEHGEDWAVVAVTDHDVCGYATALSEHAWSRRAECRMIVLPGVELDVSFRLPSVDGFLDTHVLCIFAPSTSASDVRVAIAATIGDWSFGDPCLPEELPKGIGALRAHPKYPAMCIAAHVGTSKGVREAVKRASLTSLEAAIARLHGLVDAAQGSQRRRLEAELDELESRQSDTEGQALDVLRIIGECGFDALQVATKEDETHYRSIHRFREHLGRAVPIICSDAHTVSRVFVCEDGTPFLKLGTLSAKLSPGHLFNMIRDNGLRYGETRFSFTGRSQVTRWIAGLEIAPDATDASSFWPFIAHPAEAPVASGSRRTPFVLPLSRNLNCLIGGRGSGKSAAIEAVAFVAKADDFSKPQRPKPADRMVDWYGRAASTLAGCHVKLCWKFVGDDAQALEKRALFASRYFAPNESFDDVAFSDLQGTQRPAGTVPNTSVQLFRLGDIEALATDDDAMRQLLDDICGPDMRSIHSTSEDKLAQLRKQRAAMTAVARQIATLTDEGTPLREFVARTMLYEAVNAPDVRAKYEKVDAAQSALSTANAALREWEKLEGRLDLNARLAEVKTFFATFGEKACDSEGRPLKYCAELAAICRGRAEAGEDGTAARTRVLKGLSELMGAMAAVRSDLQRTVRNAEAAASEVRSELEAAGHPLGGKERETRKRSLEEAENQLASYQELLTRWNKLLTERKLLFESLKAACRERSKLRQKTAEQIANRLKADLDPKVLIIEADAQPVEDKSQFEEWLGKHFPPRMRSVDARIRTLLQKGLSPESLRDMLLGAPNPQALVVEADKVSDGRIAPEDAEKILGECLGMRKAEPEKEKQDVDETIWNMLPTEVKEGLWVFPSRGTDKSRLAVDDVLALDEVVFDDVPVVRLNDRPTEPEASARPLEKLSAGQRCSAILPIVLLNGTGPLVIDQPEDNLDNRLIRQVVVNILGAIKLRRQVIIATHNPNLPVLGDVEQAIVLRAVGDQRCELETTGDLDTTSVVRQITDIMEGGREAFQYRQSIYQAYWSGPVDDG